MRGKESVDTLREQRSIPVIKGQRTMTLLLGVNALCPAYMLDVPAFARSMASPRNVAGLNDEISKVAPTAATRFDGHTRSTTAFWIDQSGKMVHIL